MFTLTLSKSPESVAACMLLYSVLVICPAKSLARKGHSAKIFVCACRGKALRGDGSVANIALNPEP